MKKILCEKILRVTKNRKKLEELLKVKITNRGKEVFIDGKSENEYLAEKVIDALNFGFPFSTAILIKTDDMVFEEIHIKDYTKRANLKTIRARIIGTKGGTLKTLNQLTKCYFELKDNSVGIVGAPEHIENAQDAIISLIQGAKQSNVYCFLEKHKTEEITDLGLKHSFK